MSEHMRDTGIKEQHDNLVGIFEYRKLIHDLRNGLSPILMQAQLLSQYAESPSPEGAAIKKSANAIERSVRTMEQLLDDT